MEGKQDYIFLKKRHISYLRRSLSILPSSTANYDTSRMTVLFFSLSGLDILHALDDVPEQEIQEIVEWIYSLQLTSEDGYPCGGFRGGHCVTNVAAEATPQDSYNIGHSNKIKQQTSNQYNDHQMSSVCQTNGILSKNSNTELDVRINEGDSSIPQKLLKMCNGNKKKINLSSDTNNAKGLSNTNTVYSKSDGKPPFSNLSSNQEDIHLQFSSVYASQSPLDTGHIAMTYTALASLLLLGDDLARVDKEAVLQHVASLQCPDGSFLSNAGGSENDLRFVYCAAVICHILADSSAINIDAAVTYITDCLGYAGALGQGALQESHGGSTYCGVAALHLLGALKKNAGNVSASKDNDATATNETDNATVTSNVAANDSSAAVAASSYDSEADTELHGLLSPRELDSLVRWLIMRQQDTCDTTPEAVNAREGGLQGRPNKPADTCYTFWVGAALKLLGCEHLLDLNSLLQFVLSTQDPVTGGLAKHSSSGADGLHTYLGLSGMAVLGLLPLQDAMPVDPALNMTCRAVKHLRDLNLRSRR
uniref:Geranylgeranyl transferase type-1 subunit beta-like n=1 Tax=Hirondellea gigas TaxID=1518452 RepID=A0A2P2I1I4_9CRUS